MKLLMSADTLGGVWTYSLELTRGLAPYGVEVTLATLGRSLTRYQRDQVREIRNLHVEESEFKLEWMNQPWDDVEKSGQWLLGLESKIAPDLVHLNSYAHAVLPFRVPKVIVAHSCVYSWWRAVHGGYPSVDWNAYFEAVQSGLAQADAVVCPTRAMLSELRHAYEMPLENASVIPNGTSAFGRVELSRKQPFVFAAGRLWDPAKNIVLLEEIGEFLPWPIRVAGQASDPDRGEVVFQNLEILGELSETRMVEEYVRASVFAHPACYEPFGLVVLEAASYGCALVLSDIESLRENWDGAALFAAADDKGSFFEQLKYLIEHDQARRELGRKAAQRAESFTGGKMGASYLMLYESLLEGAKRCAS